MIAGIRGSTIFVVVLSKHYFMRPYCLFELAIAEVLERPIVTIVETNPVHGGGTISSFQIPRMFEHLKNEDFIEMSQTYWESFISKLHWRMMNTMTKDFGKGFQTTRDMILEKKAPHMILREIELEWSMGQLLDEGWNLDKRVFASWEDGNFAEAFHRKCDNIGATISVIETKTGKVFGGFSPVSWLSSEHSKFSKANASWLFRFRDGPHRRINIQPGKENNAVRHNALRGPSFGYVDLRIDFSSSSFCAKSSYQSGILSDSGKIYFRPARIEVFHCIRSNDL